MKRAILIILACLMLACLGACKFEPLDTGIDITDKNSYGELPPENALAPEEYEAKKNLAFLAGVMSVTKDYKSIARGTAKAKVAFIPYEQKIYSTKECYGGKMLTLAVSTSTFVNVAEEKYFASDRVVMRRQTARSKINDENTVFTADPTQMTYEQFEKAYGQDPRKALTDYIINDETLLSADLDKAGEEYALHCVLDPVLSTALYRNQVRTMSGGSGYPEFSEVELTFRFNAKWVLREIDIREVYDIDMLGGVTCSGEMTVLYDYAAPSGEKHAYYATFDDAELGESEREVTAADCLTEGFAGIMDGSEALELTIATAEALNAAEAVTADNTTTDNTTTDNTTDNMAAHKVTVALDMEKGAYFVKIGGTEAYYKDGGLHLKANGGKYFLDIDRIKAAVKDDGADETPESPDGNGLDIDGILESLADGDFVVDKANGTATLDAVLEIKEIEIPLHFGFAVEDNRAKGLLCVKAAFDVDGAQIKLSAVPVPAEDFSHDTEGEKDLTAAVTSLMDVYYSDAFGLKAALGFDIDGTVLDADLDLFINKVTGEATVDGIIRDTKKGTPADDGTVTDTVFDYNISAVVTGGKMYASVDDFKCILGGDDVEYIKKILELVKGKFAPEEGEQPSDKTLSDIIASLGGSVGEKLPKLLDVLFGAADGDLIPVDLEAFADGNVISLVLPEDGYEFSVSGKTVKIRSLSATVETAEKEVVVPEGDYTDMTSIFRMVSCLVDYLDSRTDEDGNAVFSANVDIMLSALLKEIPVTASGDVAVKANGDYAARLNIRYDYLNVTGDSIFNNKATLLIAGDSEVELALCGNHLSIERTMTSEWGSWKKKFFTYYGEVQLDAPRVEYMYVTLDWAAEHYTEVLAFVFNFGDNINSLIADSGNQGTEEEKPAEKFELGDYIKGYSFDGTTYNVALSGAKILAKNFGNIDVAITVDENNVLQKIAAETKFANVIGIEVGITPVYTDTDAAAVLASCAATEEKVAANAELQDKES